MLYKLMPLYYVSLSWLHLRCNGSCLLCRILVFGISAQVEQLLSLQ